MISMETFHQKLTSSKEKFARFFRYRHRYAESLQVALKIFAKSTITPQEFVNGNIYELNKCMSLIGSLDIFEGVRPFLSHTKYER